MPTATIINATDLSHPLAMTPWEEGQLAALLGESIDENPYSDPYHHQEWSAGYEYELADLGID